MNKKKKPAVVTDPRERMGKLISKLKHLPAFTDKYSSVWGSCSDIVKTLYPDQYVLVTKNFDSNMQHNDMSFITHAFKDSVDKVGYIDFEHLRYLMKKRPLETEGMFRYVERHKVEYNFSFKQVNAVTLIHDGKRAIVLNKPNRFKRKYSLPGGHIDFSKNAYQKTVLDNVRNAAIQEIKEELDFSDCSKGLSNIKGLIQPLLYANYDSDWNKLFHSSFIFECKVEDISVFESIKSGEPHKHDVSIVDIKDLTLESSECAWLNACVEFITTRDTIKEIVTTEV